MCDRNLLRGDIEAQERRKDLLEKQVERCDSIMAEQVEKLRHMRYKPKRGEDYYYLSNLGVVIFDIWYDSPRDRFRYSVGNCFETLDEGRDYKSELEYRTQWKRLAEDSWTTEALDWDNPHQYKWRVGASCVGGKSMTTVVSTGTISSTDYFASQQAVYDAIKVLGEVNVLKYILKIS